ncbi:nitroreductase family protein [Telmatobacter bradus]|uniref:nitroreductase family protein n=1 Tax=Telmatobacter bradus TaxID=474953 RepID=UPI003B43199A
MSRLTVDQDQCLQDGACVDVCPARTLKLNEQGYPEEIPAARCIECGHCVAVCMSGALHHAALPDADFLPVPENRPSAESIDGFLMGRRSVREFKPEPVQRETMETLLEVARRAPTASNSQKLHWIVLSGRDKVQALAAQVVEGGRIGGLPPALLAQWDAGYDFALRGAPTVLVACAPKEYSWGPVDSATALAYVELAAEARGMGVCWAGYLTRIGSLYPPVQKLLQIPEGYAICGGLMLGEGTYGYRLIPPRKPLSVQWI